METKPFCSSLLRGLGLAALALVVAGCSPAAATIPASPQVVTVLVEITSTPPPTATDTPVPPTGVVPSATLALTDTPTTTLTSIPSPTPLLLLNVPIEGGDQNHKFYVLLVYPNYELVGTAKLWFRVYAHYPLNSKKDGDGIDNVEFTFQNSNGETVYDHVENTAGYCAFMGGEPDCTIWDLASHNYEWPNGTKIETDTYTLFINATTKPDQSGDVFSMNGSTEFKITLP